MPNPVSLDERSNTVQSMLSGQVDHVIGVDTHRDTITAAILDARHGGVVEQRTYGTQRMNYRHALRWAKQHAPDRRAWAVEGAGSYGSGLTTYLLGEGETVYEIDRPARLARRNGAKNDEIDAVRAGREALAREHLAMPRARGQREAMRTLVITRNGAIHARTEAISHLKSLIVTAPEGLRDQLRGQTTVHQIDRCARLRVRPEHSLEHRGTIRALRAAARRVQFLEAEAGELELTIRELVEANCPTLLDLHGIGVITAAQVYIAWSHPGRIRSEAAFASLAGAAPIPASSGQTIRYRLNRGGDRQLNRALHTIVLTRLRTDEQTKAYAAKRTAEGKTPREIKRCLKRAIARQLYRHLSANTQHPTAA
jgi:transposase